MLKTYCQFNNQHTCMVEFDIGKMKRILTRVNGLQVGGGTLLRRSISCKKPIPLFLTRWRSSFTRWRSSYPRSTPSPHFLSSPLTSQWARFFWAPDVFFVAFHNDILCTQATKMMFGTWRQRLIIVLVRVLFCMTTVSTKFPTMCVGTLVQQDVGL